MHVDGPPSITPALGIGMHEGIAEHVYHGDPCETPSLSRSLGQVMIGQEGSPKHAFWAHPRLGGVTRPVGKSNSLMDYGSLGHSLLLGGGAKVRIGKWDSWRKDEAQLFRDVAWERHEIPVLQHVYDQAVEMKAEAIEELKRLGFYESYMRAKKEVVFIWKRGPNWLRAKLDAFDPETATIYDFKITERPHPHAIESQAGKMGYDYQRAFYTDGVETVLPELAGRVKFELLNVEKSFPFCVVPAHFGGESKALGEMKFRRAVRIWEKCRTIGQWPGFVSRSVTLRPKPWDVQDEAEVEMPEFKET